MMADLLVLTVCAVWVGAALLAGGLPRAGTARALRRRAAVLPVLVRAGLLGTLLALAGGVATGATGAWGTLVAVPAAAAGLTAFPLLARVRAGAEAFAAAPAAPAGPALRAAAARPLLAAPIQATAFATVAVAAGTVGSHPMLGLGAAGTLAAVATLAAAVRHTVRHSMLAEGALRLPATSTRPAGLAGLAARN